MEIDPFSMKIRFVRKTNYCLLHRNKEKPDFQIGMMEFYKMVTVQNSGTTQFKEDFHHFFIIEKDGLKW
jgi:hypothetical protein